MEYKGFKIEKKENGRFYLVITGNTFNTLDECKKYIDYYLA